MKVLVTGGAGFLGKHVARVVHEAGHDVVVFDRVAVHGTPSIQGDLLDQEDVHRAVANVDAVCHLGAVGDVYLAFDQPSLAAQVNVAGTANVMEAAKRVGARKVVYASTWEVYGEPQYTPIDERHPTNPDHPYNITKLAGEHLVLSYDRLKDVPAVALRLGTAYGTGMRPNAVLPAFIDKASRGEPITINGSGEQGRQFTHASDIGAAFVKALESETRSDKFNITGDQMVTIRDAAEAIKRRIPTDVAYAEARLGDVPSAFVSSERAREVLGWQPQMTFERGLEEIIEWQLSRA